MIYKIQSLEELERLSQQVANKITGGTVITLQGDLGTGKTAFVKKILKQYSIEENSVKSPTFSLINTHKTPKLTFYHLDLYRLEQDDPFLRQEIREISESPAAVILIEWPEKLSIDFAALPSTKKIITCNLKISNSFRIIEISDI